MTIIFFGNTKYSVLGAEIIHQTFPLSHVITLHDRQKKKETIQSPVKTFAFKNNISVIETDKLTADIEKKIAVLNPDFFIVEDYGRILPEELLKLPKYAPLNIHHSLLPKYRGPSPAPSALLAGEYVSGVSIIHMIDTVDAGDIYMQQKYDVKRSETTDSLLTELNVLGGNLAVAVMEQILQGKATREKQNEQEATHTQYIKKTDGYFDIANPPSPKMLDRMIRAYYPWPTTWTRIEIKGQTKIVKFLPGDKIHVEGKNPMTLKDFYNGFPELQSTVENLLGKK